MKVAFISLGCAKNLVNTEQMMALTRAAGYELTAEPDGADAAVLNTCGFIDAAKSEAIEHILELAALKAQGRLGKLLVAGCLPQRYRDELMAELPEVDGVLGTGSYHEVAAALHDVLDGRQAALFGDIDSTVEDTPRVQATAPWTAFLKIAEGCDNRCAYCVIPSLRGRYRSRPVESLIAEAAKLADSGVRELIVVAQDITRYGTDLYGKRMLPDLLMELCKLNFDWIRLHYLYPDELDDALIDVIAREEKILKYLDIPIQHINDTLLAKMNRRGDKAMLTALFETLRARIPNVVLRTSIICGLPGEGHNEFEELCDFLQAVKFERAGVFPYSPEEGTPAAQMTCQVPPEETVRRAELVAELQGRIMDVYNQQRIGQTTAVLCEGTDPETGLLVGRSWAESPEIDGRILFTGAAKPGALVSVRLTGRAEGDMLGQMLPAPQQDERSDRA